MLYGELRQMIPKKLMKLKKNLQLITVNLGCLICVRHCAKHFSGILCFNPYENCEVEMILFPFYRIQN